MANDFLRRGRVLGGRPRRVRRSYTGGVETVLSFGASKPINMQEFSRVGTKLSAAKMTNIDWAYAETHPDDPRVQEWIRKMLNEGTTGDRIRAKGLLTMQAGKALEGEDMKSSPFGIYQPLNRKKQTSTTLMRKRRFLRMEE